MATTTKRPTTNAKTDSAGRRVAKAGEAPLARYLDKNPTAVMEAFGDWITEQTGMELTKRDRKVLFLGSALRGQFQKSDFNQKRIAARKTELEELVEARAQRKADRAAAKEEREAAKAERAERRAAKADAAEKPKATKSAATKPAAKKGPAGKAAPAKATTSRRRPAKPASKGADSDF